MDFKNYQKEFACKGMALSLPIDANPNTLIKTGNAFVNSGSDFKHKFLQNIRVTSDGIIESRPRLTNVFDITGSTSDVHSIKKLTDKASGNINYIVGSGTNINTGNASPLAIKSTGYSGLPLSIVDFRPDASIEAYAYIADKNKICKISASNIISEIGITAPTQALTWQVAEPAKKILANITAANYTDWTVTNGVTASESRINTTVDVYLADAVLPNFVSIIPTAFTSDIQAGAILTINGTDKIVEDVIASGLGVGVATIAAISYESGTTGNCSITLSSPVTEIFRNSLLLLNGTEWVRCIDIVRGANDIPVVKTSTIGTFAAGNTISGSPSFRVYATASFAHGNTIVAEDLKNSVTAAGISNLTLNGTFDLSTANGLPLDDSALFHCSLKVSNPADITEIQVQFAFDTGYVDYYYYSINPNFLTSSANQSISSVAAIQQALQRQQILQEQARQSAQLHLYGRHPELDNSGLDIFSGDSLGGGIGGSAVTQTNLGSNVWTEVIVPFNKFTRVGADDSKSRNNVASLRVSISALNPVVVSIDSIWVGGASGIDSSSATATSLLDYNYVWRYRDPTTRAISNWSPPLRNGLQVKKDRIKLTIPTNANPVTWKIDIARIGGTINDFRILASILNDSSTFTDNIADNIIAPNDTAARNSSEFSIGDFDFFKPFAVLDTPKLGTCNIIGTELSITAGDTLDVSYPRGTEISVDGRLTSFYSNPSSTTKVSLEDNLGTLTGVKFEIKEPLLTGKPLPIIAGPFGEGFEGLVIFGAGYTNAPGTLYWLDPESPDTMSDLNSREITSPTEPIMNIVIYDSYAFAYTTKRSFTISPSQDSNGLLTFIARENANSKGLFARKGICVSRQYIYQIFDDGIYRSEGVGNPVSITDADMHGLFPHNGLLPKVITFVDKTIYPPDFTKPDEMFLTSTEDHIFWRFVDTNNNQACLVFDTRLEGWISYDTFINNKVGVVYKVEGEGETDILVGQIGKVAKFSSAASTEDTLQSIVTTFADDLGDFRFLKQWSELIVNAKNGTGLTVLTSIDNGTNIVATTNLAANALRDLNIINLNSGVGFKSKNLCNEYVWSLSAGVELYKEALYFLPLGDVIVDRRTDLAIDEDTLRDKFWQGVIIEADTFAQDKTLIFLDDFELPQAILVINHGNRRVASYSFDRPFIAHKIYCSSFDGLPWIPYLIQYKFDVEPELAKVWQSQITSFGLNGFKQIKLPRITISSITDVILTVNFDGELITYTIPSTGGDKLRYDFTIAARKWKLISFRLESSSGFRLYKDDSEIQIREWNSQSDFQVIKPFGDDSNKTEVRI